jgi:6-phosphofructokinase
MRIAISTGGGDAPGLNAVIRAAVLSAINRKWEVLGIKRGYAGLMGEGRSHSADERLRARHRASGRNDPSHDKSRQPVFVPDQAADGRSSRSIARTS